MKLKLTACITLIVVILLCAGMACISGGGGGGTGGAQSTEAAEATLGAQQFHAQLTAQAQSAQP